MIRSELMYLIERAATLGLFCFVGLFGALISLVPAVILVFIVYSAMRFML